MRRIRRLAGRRTVDRYGWDAERDAWGSDIEGVAAEVAFAKGMGLYWAPSSKPDYDGDVLRWHVRSTNRTNGGLIIHPQDPDEARFALVVGEIPTFRVVGWMLARDAKDQERFSGAGRLRGPEFLVPQTALRAMDELQSA